MLCQNKTNLPILNYRISTAQYNKLLETHPELAAYYKPAFEGYVLKSAK